MKIFTIKSAGETTWICADTNIQALKINQSFTDIGLIDYDNEDEISELPKEKWRDYNITDENGKPLQTFEEYIKTAVSPDMIACTA